MKATFLDPPGHPLRYSLGGQFLYTEEGDRDARSKWFEYDLWLGVAYKEGKNVTPYGGIVYSRVDGKMQDFPPGLCWTNLSRRQPWGSFSAWIGKLRIKSIWQSMPAYLVKIQALFLSTIVFDGVE